MDEEKPLPTCFCGSTDMEKWRGNRLVCHDCSAEYQFAITLEHHKLIDGYWTTTKREYYPITKESGDA